MSAESSVESILKMLSIFVEKMEYQRFGTPSKENQFLAEFDREDSVNEDGSRTIRLSIEGECKDFFKLYVRIAGVFAINDTGSTDADFNEVLFKDNTVAIMFPYLRSQVSLLTTQPDIVPFLIPPINIAKLFSDESE